MGNFIYVKEGKILDSPSPEGSYKGVVNLELSDEQTLSFFNFALLMYGTSKSKLSEPLDYPDYFIFSIIVDCLNRIAIDSGTLDLFESFYLQVEEVKMNG